MSEAAFANKFVSVLLVIYILLLSISQTSVYATADSIQEIRVTSTAELHTAMKSAQPGDQIVIASGTYLGKLGTNASGFGSAYFNSDRSGTAENPIILRSEDPESMAVLTGERTGTGYVLRITGDYWIIENIKFTCAQKGIMFDNANNGIIRGCEVYEIGNEGIHMRDGSSYNLIENCSVTNTGKQSAGFGEGIYIGSANGSWNQYAKECDYNIIRGCKLGPNVSAEHVDIKEGTIGTIVEDCIMDGTGMSGQNYSDSFIDLKGDNANIRNNVCYRNGNTVIVDAFQLHNQIDAWGLNNEISGNTLYMDDSTCYVINATHDTSASTTGNIRIPEGNMYTGDVTVKEPVEEKELVFTAIEQNADGTYNILTDGGTELKQYSFYLLKGGKVWASGVKGNTKTIRFAQPSESGTYQLRAYVRDSSGKMVVGTIDVTF